jgi:hypothetical protein
MIKKIVRIGLLCSLFAFNLNGGVVNGVALSVNEYPITLVDIDNKMEELKITKNEAITLLIDEALYLQSLDKYRISVDNFDVENYIDKLAKNNKMTTFEFKNAVKQQEDFTAFSEKIRLQLRHQKLISAISSNKLIIANEEDLKIYYNNNQDEFKIAKKIDAIHYKSKNKALLESLKTNPMLSDPNLIVENETFMIDNVSEQMKYIISKTKEKSFSSIFSENQTYNILFISNKLDAQVIGFEDVKEIIFNTIMTNRENEYLKSYFENIKISANIKVLR